MIAETEAGRTAASSVGSLARLRPLLEIASLVRGERQLDDVIELIAQTIAGGLGWRTVVVNLYRPAWDDFEVTCVHGNVRARDTLLGTTSTWADWRPLLEERFKRGDAYVVSHEEIGWDAVELASYVPPARFDGGPDDWHPNDALVVPLVHSDGHVLGILSVDEPVSGRRPTDDELELLSAVAAQTARAVEHLQRHLESTRHRAALEHLHEVSARLSPASTPASALRAVADGAGRALGFEKVCVLVHDGDGFVPRASAGWSDDDPSLDIRLSVADIERLFEDRFEVEGCYLLPREEALERCSTGSEYASVQNGRGPHAWNRHWLLAPLRNEHGRTIGFIWADDPSDRLIPSRQTLRVLRMFANHAATALELQRTWTAEHHANQLLRATIGGSPLATIHLDRSGIVRSWNAAAEKLYGWQAKEVVGRPFPLVSPAHRLEFKHLFDSVLEGSSFSGVEVVRETRTGELIDVSVSGAPLHDADGDVVGGIAVHEDIGARKRAEKELERHTRELEALHATTLDVVEKLDSERVLEAIVARACDLLDTADGYAYLVEEDELVLGLGSGAFTPFVGARLRRGQGFAGRVWELDTSMTVGSYTEWDGRAPQFEGGEFNSVVGVPLRTKDRFIGVLGVAHLRDREFTQAEVALLEQFGRLAAIALDNARLFADVRQSQQLYEKVVDTMGDVVTLLDLEGTTVLTSRAVEHVLGYRPEELQGRRWAEFVHPDDVSRAGEAIATALAGHEPGPYVARARHKDGHWVVLEGKPALIRDERGAPEAILAIARDVTERIENERRQRELEEQLRQSQKLEAVGSLAGGIAHDFNNLLTAIAGYGALALGETPDDTPELRRDVEEMLAATERARQLVRQLLAFSRKQVLQPSVLDLNDVVRDLESMLRRLIGENIELRTRLAEPLGHTNADRSQLEQVLMNLCINARDAMIGEGRLVIETFDAELDETFVATHIGARAGSFVAIRVTDDGHGMTEEIRARVFEPFFTTKEPTKGTGLGLSTVYGIVKQSGGYVWCDTVLGEGSSFTVYLPRFDSVGADDGPAAAERPASLRGGETVLLAEDEQVVRRLVEQTLGRLGYSVLAAASGAEAVELLDAHEGKIDLLISDLVMPGMSGRELAAVVRERSPETSILFMSGYANEAVASHGVLQPGAPLLEKPFTANDLGTHVRAALDG